MKLRKLVRLCEHWEELGLRVMGPHPIGKPIKRKPVVEFEMCLGGVFLPDDTLIIEKVDVDDPECGDCDHLPRREWPIEQIGLITTDPRWSHVESPLLLAFALAVLDALSVREAE